jgi:hypothetical protein
MPNLAQNFWIETIETKNIRNVDPANNVQVSHLILIVDSPAKSSQQTIKSVLLKVHKVLLRI